MAYIYDLTDTWNAGATVFSAIKMNVTDTASAAASKLVTLQTNGTEHFSVTKGGAGYFSTTAQVGSGNSQSIVGAKAITFYNTSVSEGVILSADDTSTFTSIAVSKTGLRFATQNTERAQIDSSGNFGIGTTSPTTYGKLATIAATTATAFYAGTSSQGVYISADNVSRLVTYASSGSLSGGHRWLVGNDEKAVLDLNGNLGVGTNSPEAHLTIAGAAGSITGAGFSIFENSTGNQGRLRITQGSGEVVYNATFGTGINQHIWQIGNTERMRLKTGGQLRIIPISSAPGGAEAGDIYYDSTTNKLRCYNGTIWNDLF